MPNIAFNASTFSWEIASTRAHMYSCICGAIGALSGELHGDKREGHENAFRDSQFKKLSKNGYKIN